MRRASGCVWTASSKERTNPRDPDEFYLGLCWDSCATGTGVRATSSKRTAVLDTAALGLPSSQPSEVYLFAYNDGIFAGPYLPGGGMNIRTPNSGSSPTFTLTL